MNKILKDEDVKRIKSRKSTKWHQGLIEAINFNAYGDSDIPPWAKWGNSIVYHKKYSRHYWVID